MRQEYFMKKRLSLAAALVAAATLTATAAPAAPMHAAHASQASVQAHPEIFKREPHTRVWFDHWHGRTRVNMCANGNMLVGMVIESAGAVYPPPPGVTYNIVTSCGYHVRHK
jgi:hypothetical protein